ncbi:hypothetical protein [Deinococcus irradiatisoli]|nr:hypothetical protein [Deinococcus irradiatisoli]
MPAAQPDLDHLASLPAAARDQRPTQVSGFFVAWDDNSFPRSSAMLSVL